MSRIKIKNFGPIHDGFLENDGWMDIEKVTILIGDQGSGKSTVAKLISLFSWLEKNIFRGRISIDQLNVSVFKILCKQQELIEYFSENTFLQYEGDFCVFEYNEKNKIFKGEINPSKYKKYILPKIQYVSAARNLLTILYSISIQNIVDKNGNIIDMSSNIPFMVKDLNKEYLRALGELAKDGFMLPLNDTSVYYKNHRTFIKSKGKIISMSAASSGIQSITPLLLVSDFLSKEIQKDILDRIQNIDNNLISRIESELTKEDESLSEKFMQIYSFGKGILQKKENVTLLKDKLKKYIPSAFINVVEEPEQNLFPTSQQKVINRLLEYNNAIDRNKLIVTTHSPYIIGYFTLAIKADELFHKTDKEDVLKRIDRIVPQKSAVNHQDVAIYELDENDGTIRKLNNYNGVPSSKNYLNRELAEKNELFAQLLDIEDLCK